jgi:hypothetical protein
VKRFTLPGNEVILYALALAQMFGLAYAVIAYDGAGGVMTVITTGRGLLLGGALSFGLAMSAQRVPRIQSRRARVVGYIAAAGLMLVSPVIMAPAVYAAFPGSFRAIMPAWLLWVVAVSVAVAPDFVAAALGATGGALAPATKSADSEIQPRPARPRWQCAKCGRPAKSQNSLNAHMRIHRKDV